MSPLTRCFASFARYARNLYPFRRWPNCRSNAHDDNTYPVACARNTIKISIIPLLCHIGRMTLNYNAQRRVNKHLASGLGWRDSGFGLLAKFRASLANESGEGE